MVDNRAVVDDLSAIIGEVVWKPIRTHGSMLFLHFGDHIVSSNNLRSKGKFRFLVEFADWHFFNGKKHVVAMDSDTEVIDDVFRTISPNKVEKLSFDPDRNFISIDLGNNITFILSPCSDLDYRKEIQWIFFGPRRSWRFEGEDILLSNKDIS